MGVPLTRKCLDQFDVSQRATIHYVFRLPPLVSILSIADDLTKEDWIHAFSAIPCPDVDCLSRATGTLGDFAPQ